MTACVRRELFEETGISGEHAGVALVVESVPPGSSRRLLDIVFAVAEPVLGRESCREVRLEPQYVPLSQLASLNLHPSLAARLVRFLDSGGAGYAPYIGNLWRQPGVPGPDPEA